MDYTTPVTALKDFHDEDIREFLRVTEINKLGRKSERRDLAGFAILAGHSPEMFRAELLKAAAPERAPGEVGLTAKETRQYSVHRAIVQIAQNPASKYNGLEFEASAA